MLQEPLPTPSPQAGPTWRGALALGAVALLMALVWLRLGGAWSSDFAGDPDEAAHAVTSLMLRDYLAQGLGQAPMEFARSYYDHFPRVALGHYPPLYYLVQAPLLLWFNDAAALWLTQALLFAALALAIWRLAMACGLPSALGWAVALSALLLPITLKWASMVMAELLLGVLVVWAVELWLQFMRRPSAGLALCWGSVAAAAVLTKASGVMVAALPLLAPLACGQWRLWRDWRWWLAALPALVFALPWMLWSAGISSEGMTGMRLWDFAGQAVAFYPQAGVRVWGWGLSLLALGTWLSWGQRAWQRTLGATEATLAAAVLGALAVLLLIPVGLTSRYLMPMTPLVVLLAALGLWAILGRLAPALARRRTLVLLLMVWLTARMFNPPLKRVEGFAAAVAKAEALCGAKALPERWLVSSDPRGEGAVIAAAALAARDRVHGGRQVLRASQWLSSSDWMGRNYQLKTADSGSVLALLEKQGVALVLLDDSQPEQRQAPHHELLSAAMESGAWQQAAVVEVIRSSRQGEGSGRLRLFCRRGAIKNP